MRVLITGANRGIGLAVVKALLADGFDVIAGVRDPARAVELQELQGNRTELPEDERISRGEETEGDSEVKAGSLTLLKLDVDDESSICDAAVYVKGAYGEAALDVIINNAAIAVGRARTAEEVELSEFEQTFRTNVFGPALVCKHFLPLLKRSDSGKGRACIVNMSSASGIISRCGPRDYSYAMSKAALNMFTGILRNQLTERGVTVYAVHPGWVRTDQGGMEAPLAPEEPAEQIRALITGEITPDHDGFFIHSDGTALPF